MTDNDMSDIFEEDAAIAPSGLFVHTLLAGYKFVTGICQTVNGLTFSCDTVEAPREA